jgi:hypothetical protein
VVQERGGWGVVVEFGCGHGGGWGVTESEKGKREERNARVGTGKKRKERNGNWELD